MSGRDTYHVTFEVNTVPSFDGFLKFVIDMKHTLMLKGYFLRFEQRYTGRKILPRFFSFFDQRKGKAKTSEGQYDIPIYVNDIVSAFFLLALWITQD